MKNHVNILIFLFVFIGLSGRAYANIDSISFIGKQDTAICIVIHFEEGQSIVNESFANNKQALTTLDSLLRYFQMTEQSFEWQIKSYASPDGRETENMNLASQRSESVREFLWKSHLNIDKSNLKILSGGEDWAEFRVLIASDPNLPDREEVLMLMDYHSGDIVKQKQLIRKLNTGISYRYIVQYVLPKLRRSEVNIYWNCSNLLHKRLGEVDAVPSDTCSGNDLGRAIKKEEQELLPIIPSANEKQEKRSHETMLAIKNNLIYDLALAPNIEIEIPIGKKWSLNTEYKCPWWINNNHDFCYQLLSGGVEARYWLGNRQDRNKLTGHFLGLYAEGGTYDFQFGDNGYQGKYYGASGLSYGYALQLARHFSMEFSLGVGYLTTEYTKYVSYDKDIVRVSNGRYNFIGPTKVKVSLVWLLIKRR